MKPETSEVSLLNHKHIVSTAILIIASAALFALAGLFQPAFEAVMNETLFISWHIVFEFASILVSFAVFVSSYYTYNQAKNLRSVFMGAVFLFTGLVDMFHTLSYKGMPPFFMVNCCANRATIFWVISRFFGTAGIAVSAFIRNGGRKSKPVGRFVFFAAPLLLSLVIFITATYYPSFFPEMYIEGVGLTPVKVFIEYVIIALMLFSAMRFISEYGKTLEYMNILLAQGMIISIFSELTFVMYFSPYDIHNFLGHIYKVIAFYLIFKGIFIISVQKPYMELALAQSELKNYAENLDRLINERTQQIKEINQKLLDDLEYARDIQLSMLPPRLPDNNEISFAASYFPAERVGGDFYNIFNIDKNHIGFYIGDVSGHGVPAAMMTVFVKQSVRTLAELNGSNGETTKPSHVLKKLYESFNNTNFKEEVYIVLLYGVYDLRSMELTFASAGLNVSPMLIRSSGEIEVLDINGFPICKFMEFYYPYYENMSIKFNTGDKLLLYTDGLIENRNSFGEEYSEKRLLRVLKEGCVKTAEELSEDIKTDVFTFMGGEKVQDDITFFIMEVKQPKIGN